MKISFAEPDQPRSGAVVVGVWEEGVLTPAARRLDEATSGAISRALSAAPRFSGKKDELLPIVGPANLSVSRIVLAGLGKPDLTDPRSLQQLGGNLVAHLNGTGEKEATFVIEVGEGAQVGATSAANAAQRAYKPLGKTAEAVFFTRDLVSEPANVIYPET